MRSGMDISPKVRIWCMKVMLTSCPFFKKLLRTDPAIIFYCHYRIR
jgi:hypothetical protein